MLKRGCGVTSWLTAVCCLHLIRWMYGQDLDTTAEPNNHVCRLRFQMMSPIQNGGIRIWKYSDFIIVQWEKVETCLFLIFLYTVTGLTCLFVFFSSPVEAAENRLSAPSPPEHLSCSTASQTDNQTDSHILFSLRFLVFYVTFVVVLHFRFTLNAPKKVK